MKTVLIIEDNEDIRANTAEILELSGYCVIVSENGEDGVRVASEVLPDVILCDILMPGINGYDVFSRLRDNAATSHIPLIYLTASTEKSDVSHATQMGANGYIHKPFVSQDLVDEIEAVCMRPHTA